ncbi:MAG: phosphatidylserine decarboxylase family protein, partial [Candidatus Hydrogenedentes bacterium CG07_land_8_20_14_0_80_42_17]
GRGYVGAALAAGLGLLLFGGSNARKIGYSALGIAGGLMWFFRDPDRYIFKFENGILAPADGHVIRIDKVEMPEYFAAPVRRVSIFMSLFDCHINRAPVSGTVIDKKPSEGGFLAAWDNRASEENRRTTMMIDGVPKCAMRQISGFVARQIVTNPEIGDQIEQGEKIGMIKFGSRVDVFFPLELRVMVNIGDRTIAGYTPVAEVAECDE